MPTGPGVSWLLGALACMPRISGVPTGLCVVPTGAIGSGARELAVPYLLPLLSMTLRRIASGKISSSVRAWMDTWYTLK